MPSFNPTVSGAGESERTRFQWTHAARSGRVAVELLHEHGVFMRGRRIFSVCYEHWTGPRGRRELEVCMGNVFPRGAAFAGWIKRWTTKGRTRKWGWTLFILVDFGPVQREMQLWLGAGLFMAHGVSPMVGCCWPAAWQGNRRRKERRLMGLVYEEQCAHDASNGLYCKFGEPLVKALSPERNMLVVV